MDCPGNHNDLHETTEMRDKITKRKVDPLKLNSAGFSVEVSINWYEINAGFVSSNTAEAIVAGEDFDEAVEDDIGDHPTNGQALPESNFIKVGSQLADLSSARKTWPALMYLIQGRCTRLAMRMSQLL